jgi:hypothetical protein
LSQVRFHGARIDAERSELGRGLFDFRFIGRDQQIVAGLCAFTGEVIADAGRCAGDDRELS